MIDKLFHLLQKPTLWQRSTEPFWDDEHINISLLELFYVLWCDLAIIKQIAPSVIEVV